MGLRISTSLSSLIALQHLNLTDRTLQKTMNRLSTGERLNGPEDGPTDLSLSESLRAQIRALDRTGRNATSARDMLNTADAALGEITELLLDIQEAITFAASDGSASTAQVAAEQEGVDRALNAIRQIAATTRSGNTPLLNGSAGFTVSDVTSAGIVKVKTFAARLNPVVDVTPFQVTVSQVAEQAQALAGGTAAPGSVAAVGGDVVLRLTGPSGTVDLSLPAGMTSAELQAVVNDNRDQTGVYAVNGYLRTEGFGSAATFRIEQIGGTGTFAGGNPAAPGLSGVGAIYVAQGQDAVGTMNGVTANGVGNTLYFNTPFFTGEIELNPATNEDGSRGPGSAGTFSFSVARSGMAFQFGTSAIPSNQPTLGISSMAPEDLGKESIVIGGRTLGGLLNTLATGGGNDLYTNPDNASLILEQALEDVTQARAVVGAFVANVVEPVERTQEVMVENLKASDSTLRDADMAADMAELTRLQVLLQSGLAVLGQANAIPQSVLELLK